MNANTLFLRIEGPFQSWGVNESKFVIRRSSEAPTKSGVIGLILAAMGVSRGEADIQWLPEMSKLAMAVRIDRPGIRWWDYHTVGAGMRMRTAETADSTKPGAMLTRREYLCDASFLVALQGSSSLINEIRLALENPRWTPYLGRKSCPPSRPLLDLRDSSGSYENLETALSSKQWSPRLKTDALPEKLKCFIEWKPTVSQQVAPFEATTHYDVPITLSPPAHGPRFVLTTLLCVKPDGQVEISKQTTQNKTPPPPRPSANYKNSLYRQARAERLSKDSNLCVLCKMPASTVHHVTYQRAGGDEKHSDLRSLCRLCHDAVTMLEYGSGMGMDRIDPCLDEWRDLIITKRDSIVKFRSLETRRRKLEPGEVE